MQYNMVSCGLQLSAGGPQGHREIYWLKSKHPSCSGLLSHLAGYAGPKNLILKTAEHLKMQ